MKRALLLLSIAFTSACGPSVDLTKGVQVEALSTGWFDAGVVDGKNKVVPALSFKLKNVSDQPLKTLQVNAVFRRVSRDEEWGSGFRTVAGSVGLAPGAAHADLPPQEERQHEQRQQRRGPEDGGDDPPVRRSPLLGLGG